MVKPLIVEEYPVVARGVYTPDRLEYMQRIDSAVLQHRLRDRN